MTSQQLDEERIFHVARDIQNPDTRAEYLDQVCAGDNALRERVEALLAVHESEQSFLKSDGDLRPTVDQSPVTETAGQQIGRYKLLQKIGEGGFGVVYMAEQSRPIRRKVALKIIKPGMDTHAVVARFEAERQALAMMDHPNIARVLDGGATDSGRPYFVMELVRGVPITEYCDKNNLATQERLQLFMTICQAVQHAHQKGIIHRDLKPSNVLVTLADGEPIVKVIDFGVAKATNQQLTEKTLFTAYGQIVGTPQYMSPEQAEMSGLDVDTRSDIYSLGVLLYELLTGTTPVEAERLRAAGYAEMQRIIREDEPPKPSTRLSTSGEKLTAIAKHRSVSPEKLKSQVKGDLDWIVMKALEKDRSRRYDTPSSFALDVSNFLNDEPVDARPPTLGYKAAKYLRRNRIAITAATVLFALLSVALASYVHQAKVERQLRHDAVSAAREADLNAEIAEQQRRRAETEAKRAQDELELRKVAEEVARRRAQELSSTLHKLEQTVKNYHNQLIESALVHAALGDIAKVQTIIESVNDEDFPRDWRLTLEGLAYLHRGDNDLATEKLREAVLDNGANVSAKAMLALACFHTGHWNEWVVRAEDVRDDEPREAYNDFDELFLAYAWFYSDFEKAAERLESIVAKHPTWVIARALLANAYAHHVVFEKGEKELMVKALGMIRETMTRTGENQFTLIQAFYVHSTAMYVLGDETGELRAQADQLATQLEKYPKYLVGVAVRSVYYDRIRDAEKRDQAWQDLLKHGRGMVIHWPAAGMFREGRGREVTLHEWAEPEAKIARAYILALSTRPDDNNEAREIYEELVPEANTWFLRHFLIQIPLLLEDPALAQGQCEKWLQTPTRQECKRAVGGWEKETIEFVADPSNIPFDPSSADPDENFTANYQMAMLKYAKRDLQGAISHLDACQAYPLPFLQWWVAAFRQEFEERIAIQ